jgi:hypothetical protein
MWLVRALPMIHLMPAACSRQSPVAAGTSADVPERMSGRIHRREHPIGHHVTGPRTGPRTQIRLGAGAHTPPTNPTPPIRPLEIVMS